MFFKPILENTYDNRVDITAAADQYMSLRVEGLNLTCTIGTIFYAEIWLLFEQRLHREA